jgi:hypothetical protein
MKMKILVALFFGVFSISRVYAEDQGDDGCFFLVDMLWKHQGVAPSNDGQNPDKPYLHLPYPVVKEQKLNQQQYISKRQESHPQPVSAAGRLGKVLRDTLRDSFSSISTLVHFYKQETTTGSVSVGSGYGQLGREKSGEIVKAETVKKVEAQFLVDFCNPNTLIPYRDEKPPGCISPKEVTIDITPYSKSEGKPPKLRPVVEPLPAPMPDVPSVSGRRPPAEDGSPPPSPAPPGPSKKETEEEIKDLNEEFENVYFNSNSHDPVHIDLFRETSSGIDFLSDSEKTKYLKRLVKALNDNPNMQVKAIGQMWQDKWRAGYQNAFPGPQHVTQGNGNQIIKNRDLTEGEKIVLQVTRNPLRKITNYGLFYEAQSLTAAMGLRAYLKRNLSAHFYGKLKRPNQIECVGSRLRKPIGNVHDRVKIEFFYEEP